MSRPADDSIFWGVKDLTLYWGRFIDDVLNFFQGCEKQAEWYFEKLNALYPGQVHFKWECSSSKGIFLNIEIFKNEKLKIFETKYYVKPSKKRLLLHYRSNHPQHTFKSIVYSQALQGIMINSREDWNIEYLRELREKFLIQDYPLSLINEQFKRAMQMNRNDLLVGQNNNKKKKVIIAPLVVTHNPGNPPFHSCIKNNLAILHEDRKVKKAIPSIRQAPNIAKQVIKSRHWELDKEQNNSPNLPPPPPPGNYMLHNKNCVTCLRMEDGKSEYQSAKTGRIYRIRLLLLLHLSEPDTSDIYG